MQTDSTEHQYIYNLLKDNLKLLNNHLKGKTYLVGKTVTIADIFLTLITMELQQVILDPNFRNSMSNLNSHFKKITTESFFKSRMGTVKQGKKSIGPVFEAVAKKEDLAKA